MSGPGGVGKGTVVEELRRRRPDVLVSVSATTRAPRPGERDGREYHFLADSDFQGLVDDGGFLEWAEFAGARYGTPWSSIEHALASGRPVVLEIDVQGARQVRARRPDAVLVFLAPPDEQALLARMEGRGTDPPQRVAERMAIARWELGQAEDFDHVITNDDLDEAVQAVIRILDASGPASPSR